MNYRIMESHEEGSIGPTTFHIQQEAVPHTWIWVAECNNRENAEKIILAIQAHQPMIDALEAVEAELRSRPDSVWFPIHVRLAGQAALEIAHGRKA